jgi:hypothetical protein
MVPSETTPHRAAVTRSAVPGGDTAKTLRGVYIVNVQHLGGYTAKLSRNFVRRRRFKTPEAHSAKRGFEEISKFLSPTHGFRHFRCGLRETEIVWAP